MANTATGKRTTVEEFAEQYAQMKDEELPVSLGFSARLNMLWDLVGVVPSQTEGRVISVLGVEQSHRSNGRAVPTQRRARPRS